MLNKHVMTRIPLKLDSQPEPDKNQNQKEQSCHQEEVDLFAKLDHLNFAKLGKLGLILKHFSFLNLESNRLEQIKVAIDSKKGPIVPIFLEKASLEHKTDFFQIACSDFLYFRDLREECLQIVKMSTASSKICLLLGHVEDLFKMVDLEFNMDGSYKQIIVFLEENLCTLFPRNFLLVFSGNINLTKPQKIHFINAFHTFLSLRVFDLDKFFRDFDMLTCHINSKLAAHNLNCDFLRDTSELVKHKLTFIECDVLLVAELVTENILNFGEQGPSRVWEGIRGKTIGSELEGTKLQIPNVEWADIGGMDLVKDKILSLFRKNDEAGQKKEHARFQLQSTRRAAERHGGVLFFGPPGTGKTLLAKCIAKNMKANFLSVKGPELLNKYIGESEANLRKIFSIANSLSPCFIFFDELDSLFPKRDSGGDSANVSGRLVSQFLTELDNTDPGVFVIAATNRPDLLDSSLLVSGRFDKKVYLGAMEDKNKRIQVLGSVTRHMGLDPSLLGKIESIMPNTMTGADVYALCVKAFGKALKRKQAQLENKAEPDEEDYTVRVVFEDIRNELDSFKPSLDSKEMARYNGLARQYADVIVK